MPKRLLLLNLVLVAAAVVFSVQLARVFTTPRLPPPPASRQLPPAPSAKEEAAPAPVGLPAYGVIATKNLFNFTRSETPAPAAGPAAAVAKLQLFGVVIEEGRNVAFLEDPATKRVFGYKTGDAIAGGQLERIEADRVTIKRGEESIEILLRDPSKPKAVASVPAQPARPTVPGVAPTAPGPPSVQPPPPVPPARRPLPPNIRGRPQWSAPPPAGNAPSP